MGKRIWIVNYYTGIPGNAAHPRYVQFSHYFRQAGYDVITFNADHKSDPETPLFTQRTYGEHRFVHVKAPHYEGNGLKRMYSIWVFAWQIFRHCKAFDRPEVILHNIHTPFDYPIVWVAKKLKCKYIAEAWDLWPENFVSLGLVSRRHPAMRLFYQIEKRLYEHADQIVFTFLGAFDYLKRKGWTLETGGKIDMSRVHYINNGVDLEEFDHDKVAYPRTDPDLNREGIYKIVYVGAISHVNHVKGLIDAAQILQEDARYQFFIYGDGADRTSLEQYVKDHDIRNVFFKERHIPLCEVAWVVCQATVNVMNYEHRFGQFGVSAGKLFQYLAAGKPIVCNINIPYDDIITDHQLGVAREMDSPAEMAQEIKRLAEQPAEEYRAMCQRVREVAACFDYQKLAAQELKVIADLEEINEK